MRAGVIDSHAHIGAYGAWDCKADKLAGYMTRAGIEHAVVGHLQGNVSGAESFDAALESIRGFRGRMSLMLWVDPAADDLAYAERTLEEHGDVIACMKAHPTSSRVPLGDCRYQPYIGLCRKYSIPFVSHTERDGYCDTAGLALMAADAPDVDFIAVHMDMRGDHIRAAEIISRYPNLYGDTTFVPADDVRRAIDICGAEKILFGSDAPVIGDDCYGSIGPLRERLTAREAELVMRENAEKILALKI